MREGLLLNGIGVAFFDAEMFERRGHRHRKSCTAGWFLPVRLNVANLGAGKRAENPPKTQGDPRRIHVDMV